MKNLFTRLNRRKGFTLVECLIALTVFAALTLVVFAILANARAASVKANETEENLTKLIDTVVADDTFARYNANLDNVLELQLQGGGTPFRVTYNEIDGYKNYVLCDEPTCQHFADNTEFMGCDAKDYTQGTYTCPKCDTTITQELVCEDCGKTADHTDKTAFTYTPSNGGYCCNDCGSTGVRGSNINENTISNYDLNVRTVVPNAIVYGDAERKTDPNTIFDTQSGADDSSIVSNIKMRVEYTPGANATIPGTYELRIRSDCAESNFKISVRLPGGYTVRNLTPINGDCYNDKDIDGPFLMFHGCDTNAESVVEFQLINSTSGFSFEDDYNNPTDTSVHGLSGYWFHTTNATLTDYSDPATS